MAGGQSTSEFPWQHSFPPFYTLQPHQETQRKQIEAWRSIVLGIYFIYIYSVTNTVFLLKCISITIQCSPIL